ncbi:MAG: hypothetical protein LBC53_08005 [Spirochaetaceae bacterium]|nr:hypothetical protein [Spirochaetaceae bacterium]
MYNSRKMSRNTRFLQQISLLLTVFCITAALSAQTTLDAPAAESSYNKGLNFAAEEDWYGAAEAFLEALKYNGAHAGAAYSLAECYYELAEYDEALNWALKAKSLSRLSTDAANLEAFILIAMGRLDAAEPIIAGVLKQEPYNRKALFAAAELDVANGRTGEAVRRYREAARLYPQDRRLLISLALVTGSLGDSAASMDYIKRAQKAHPGDYRVSYYASYLKARAGQIREAIEDAENVVNQKPNFQEARDLLASLRYQNGDYNETILLTDAAISENRNNSGAWFLRGMALTRLDRGDEGRRSFAVALGIDSGDEWSRAALEESLLRETGVESPERARWAAWHFSRASQYKQRKLYEDALFEYRRGLRINPYAEQRADYAEILLLQGYKQKYLDEMLFIQNETGKANKAVNDAVETYTALLRTSFAAQNPVDASEIKPHWNAAVFSVAGQSSFYHADAAYIVSTYIKDISVHNRNFSVMDVPIKRESFSAAFRAAREIKADYFIVLSVAENERDISINAEMYVSRTGSKAASFNVFRAGADRLRGASKTLVDQISAALPFRAVLLRRDAGKGVIDKGRFDKIAENAVFNVVKAGKAEISNEGVGIKYLPQDVTGTFTVKNIDELISGGDLERSGFFDSIAAGDEIFEQAPKEGETKNTAVETVKDPELRSLLRSLR